MMDAGNDGVLILADKMLPPPQARPTHPRAPVQAMKLAVEKYFRWKARHGYINLT
jgi:sulfide:quinone oxidoreductase